MIHTTLPMLTAGNLKNLDCETWQKLVQFLQDNPHVILVLNERRLLLFTKESYVRIRRSLYKTVEEFNSDFSLKLVERSRTDTFIIATQSMSTEWNNMEILAVEVSANLTTSQIREPQTDSASTETSKRDEQHKKAESKREKKSTATKGENHKRRKRV